MSSPTGVTSPPKRGSRIPLLVLLVGLLGGGGVLGYYYLTEMHPITTPDFAKLIRNGVVNPDKLGEEFTDAKGNMVADTPAADKRLNPDTLVFSTLDLKLETAQKHWKEFCEHLQKETGKKVKQEVFGASGREIAEQMKEDKLHIAMLSTGSVPLAVNTAGFVPCCVMADENGNFAYQMEILVPADSKIKTPAEIRGKKVQLTSLSSLSSFKAPVVYLWKEHKLRPGLDYEVLISTSQKASIQGLVNGDYEVIAVANDLLARIVQEERIDPKSYRTIYKSESYPPACFGYSHKLDPDLATKIRKAFLSFSWKGTALSEAYKAANQAKFVEVTYKKDWASVREVDKAIRELTGADK